MKLKKQNHYFAALAFPLLLTAIGQHARAGTFTWTNAATGGNWADSGNWSAAPTFAADDVLDFSTLNITAQNTTNLQTTPRIAGTLIFGDTTPNFNWIVRQSTLTLATTTSSKPEIQVINQAVSFGGIVAGTQGFNKTGAGIVAFTGLSNTHTGGIVVTGGTLSVYNASSAVDTMLGAVPGSPSAANISLAAGTTFANHNIAGLGSNLTLNANRGITLTGGGVNTFKVVDTPGTGSGPATTVTINGAITGSGTINHTGNDNSKLTLNGNITTTGGVTNSNGSMDLGGINTYTGDTSVNVGTVSLILGAQLGDTDSIIASGATMLLFAGSQYNMVLNGLSSTTITGTGTIFLAGTLNFDLALANITNGNTWQVVSNSTLTEAYTGSFQVNGFTQLSDVWTRTAGLNTWTFTEGTGVLSLAVIPEPTAALLGGLGVLGLLRRRRI